MVFRRLTLQPSKLRYGWLILDRGERARAHCGERDGAPSGATASPILRRPSAPLRALLSRICFYHRREVLSLSTAMGTTPASTRTEREIKGTVTQCLAAHCVHRCARQQRCGKQAQGGIDAVCRVPMRRR